VVINDIFINSLYLILGMNDFKKKGNGKKEEKKGKEKPSQKELNGLKSKTDPPKASEKGGGPIKPKDESEKAELDAIYDEDELDSIRCEPYETVLITMKAGSSGVVGDIEVMYKGIDKEGNAVYDITGSGNVLRSDVKVAVGETVPVEIPEHRLNVGIAVKAANEQSARAEITVDAY
jgi:hypothetical protein